MMSSTVTASLGTGKCRGRKPSERIAQPVPREIEIDDG